MGRETVAMTHGEWIAEAERRFGSDPLAWRFVCPCCGHEAAARDWKNAGAPPGAVGFSCIGRWLGNPRKAFAKGPGPCDYAGGGLFRVSPNAVTLDDGSVLYAMAFADPPTPEAPQ